METKEIPEAQKELLHEMHQIKRNRRNRVAEAKHLENKKAFEILNKESMMTEICPFSFEVVNYVR